MLFALTVLIQVLWSKKDMERKGTINYKMELPVSLVEEVINVKPTFTGLTLSFDRKKCYDLSAKKSNEYKPKIFGDFINVGDSIQKKAANDTVLVSRKGVTYIWLLAKPATD